MITASKWTAAEFEAWVLSVGGVAFAARNLGVTERTVIDYCHDLRPVPLAVEHACNWITSQGWRSKTIDYMPAHGKGKGGVRQNPVYPWSKPG